MIFFVRKLILFLILSCCLSIANAQSDWVFAIDNPQKEHSNIINYLQILEDSTEKLSLAEVKKQTAQFKLFPKTTRPFKIKSVYWGKLVIHNQQIQHTDWYLSFLDKLNVNLIESYGFIDNQAVFDRKGGTYRLQSSLESINQRFKVYFSIPPQKTLELYIRIENINNYPINFNCTLQNALYSEQKDLNQEALQFFLQGALWMMVIYNFLLWFSIRDNTYLFYIGYLSMANFYFLFQSFFLFKYFLGEYPKVAIYINALAEQGGVAFYFCFVRTFFDVGQNFQFGNRLGKIILGVIILNLSINYIVLFSTFNLYWSDILLIFPTIVIVIIGAYYTIKISQKKQLAGRLVFLGVLILLITAIIAFILASLVINGIILSLTITDIATLIQWGVIVEVVLFSLGLGFKTRQIERDKQAAQEKTIEVQQAINEELEKKIIERTERLREANEELQLQQEETLSINDNLERTIELRTKELHSAIENLIQQNQDLEQFSYIISHNLRAPVAHVLGLISIINKDNLADPSNQRLLDLIEQASNNLDATIKDLDKILTIKNQLDKIKEKVHLVEVVKSVKNNFMPDIESLGAIIREDYIEEDILFSVKEYIHSIVHQLISNALKFHNPDRVLEIHLSITRTNQYLCFKIQDNGLGIDNRYGGISKVFGLYKKMHENITGKGLGLFLLKSQIESLGGYVEVESQLNVGSTFSVFFPIML
jgi:signal transduction histidine kinase